MREPIVHFFLNVSPILLKLSQCVPLEPLYPLVFPLYLLGDFGIKLSLPDKSFLLFHLDLVFDLLALLLEPLQNLFLLLNSGLSLLVYCHTEGFDVFPDRNQLSL